MARAASSYVGFRYPVEIISHGVWLYFRFALSLRDVSEGIVNLSGSWRLVMLVEPVR